MRLRSIVVLFSICGAGCQVRAVAEQAARPSIELAAARFPSGTYTSCARGVHNPNGSIFMNTAGFEAGGVLTLTQSGSAVRATYVDQNKQSQSMGFTAMTATAAVLSQPVQVSAGLSGMCVKRPGTSAPYPATMNAAAGAMTYNAGTVFVTLTGGLVSEAGECGRLTQPDAAFWLSCGGPAGDPLRDASAAPAPATRLPVGSYSCRSQVQSTAQVNGIRNVAGGGGAGTLVVTQDDARVSGAYAGDASLGGTLRFALTSSTTARVESGQTLQTACTIPMGRGIPLPAPQPLPITAGSLTLVGSKLFVSVTGTMGASCAEARVAGTLICSKQP